MKLKGRGVLDTPLEPVIGLAEGETRWRGMTALCSAEHAGRSEDFSPLKDSTNMEAQRLRDRS